MTDELKREFWLSKVHLCFVIDASFSFKNNAEKKRKNEIDWVNYWSDMCRTLDARFR